MTIFYWVMGVLIAGTFVPSVLCLLLYFATGSYLWSARAKSLWDFSRVLMMFGINILIWGHVAVGLWDIWAH